MPRLISTCLSSTQSLSVAQKIGKALGSAYNADLTPGPYVYRALMHLDDALGQIMAALKATRVNKDITIILTAKHGQVSQKSRQQCIVVGALKLGWVAGWVGECVPL